MNKKRLNRQNVQLKIENSDLMLRLEELRHLVRSQYKRLFEKHEQIIELENQLEQQKYCSYLTSRWLNDEE